MTDTKAMSMAMDVEPFLPPTPPKLKRQKGFYKWNTSRRPTLTEKEEKELIAWIIRLRCQTDCEAIKARL